MAPRERTVEEYVVPEKDRARLWHIYRMPDAPGFTPLGTRALCGHVKDIPSSTKRTGKYPDSCVVCNELWDAGVRP